LNNLKLIKSKSNKNLIKNTKLKLDGGENLNLIKNLTNIKHITLNYDKNLKIKIAISLN
jgi:hypothetical protein